MRVLLCRAGVMGVADILPSPCQLLQPGAAGGFSVWRASDPAPPREKSGGLKVTPRSPLRTLSQLSPRACALPEDLRKVLNFALFYISTRRGVFFLQTPSPDRVRGGAILFKI